MRDETAPTGFRYHIFGYHENVKQSNCAQISLCLRFGFTFCPWCGGLVHLHLAGKASATLRKLTWLSRRRASSISDWDVSSEQPPKLLFPKGFSFVDGSFFTGGLDLHKSGFVRSPLFQISKSGSSNGSSGTVQNSARISIVTRKSNQGARRSNSGSASSRSSSRSSSSSDSIVTAVPAATSSFQIPATSYQHQ